MSQSHPSALVNGAKVLFRIDDEVFEISQVDLRSLLGLPAGPSGLGIIVNENSFQFEFARDEQAAEMTAKQLKRRLLKHRAAVLART